MEFRPPSSFALAALIDGPLHRYAIVRRAVKRARLVAVALGAWPATVRDERGAETADALLDARPARARGSRMSSRRGFTARRRACRRRDVPCGALPVAR